MDERMVDRRIFRLYVQTKEIPPARHLGLFDWIRGTENFEEVLEQLVADFYYNDIQYEKC